jgi:RND family efflux transporter MFP subunit
MKRAYWQVLATSLILIMAAAGCSSPTPAAPAPTQGATVAATTQSTEAGSVGAKVVVEPARTANMAFEIAAPVKAVNVKEGDQVKAGQVLIVLHTPDLASAVDAAQGELHSALANQSVQREGRQTRIQRGHRLIWLGSMPEIRRQADARVLQAQAALEVAQANLAQSMLVAPFDGTVVSIDAVPGEMVEAHKTLVVMGDLQHLQIATTDLSEREIANVHIGQTATARLKAFDQDLTGTVIAIAPMAHLSDGDTVYKVTVKLDQQPEGLLWGMTGDITIEAP